MWLVVALMLAASTPMDVVEISDKIPCTHDVVCGKGDCWKGFCEADGFCAAYWTCA